MNLAFREVRPADVNEAVELIYSAAADAYEFLYAVKGQRARDYIRYEFERGSGFLGAAAHTLAVADGRVVGIGSFYTKLGYKAMSSEQAKNFIARFGLWEFLRMMPRGLRIQRGISKLKGGQLYVANLGVKKELRSQGIGKALIEFAAQRDGALGLAALALDVPAQSPRAEALYQRPGFSVIAVNRIKTKPRDIQLPNTKSMMRVIR